MITKEVKCYEFSELSERAQEKVLQEFWDINVDYDDWTDVSYYEEQLQEFGFEDAKILYSGFGSQGDGACFETDCVDILKWIEKTKREKDFPVLFMEMKYGDNNLDIHARFSQSGHYYHHNAMNIDLDWSYYLEDENPFMYTKLEEETKILESSMLDFARDKAQDIYSSLEKEFDYLTSREQIVETIEANEYLFDEDGRIM